MAGRTQTTWAKGHHVGRPPGTRNRATKEFRKTVAALDRAGEIDLKRLVRELYADATSDNPAIRIPARREMLNRVHGLPRVEVDVSHDLGPSAVALLVAIATSDEHRDRAESLEQWREARRLTAGNTANEEDSREHPPV